MGEPAAVMGDRVTGICPAHQIPPGSPAGPLPFSAPLLEGLASTVMIGGRPAAVAGAAGLNTPPHIALYASDPSVTPMAQRGTVVAGSTTVFFDGKPAAKTGSRCTICVGVPGQLAGSAATVLIGG